MTKKAHQASIDVFEQNLKGLLLSPPLPNTTVLGLDPGIVAKNDKEIDPSVRLLFVFSIRIKVLSMVANALLLLQTVPSCTPKPYLLGLQIEI